MKKTLQILLGFLLILVLAYVSFLDVSSKIKDDLFLKTETMFSEKNLRGVSIQMKGEGLRMSRTLVLTGTTISEVERVRIVTLSESIEGICSVDNQIKLHPVVPKASVVPKVPTVIKTPLVKVAVAAVIVKNTPKELVTTNKRVAVKSTDEKYVDKEMSISSVLEKKTEVPMVPTVIGKSIVVPTPIKAINAPKVIEVEKIKVEGVK